MICRAPITNSPIRELKGLLVSLFAWNTTRGLQRIARASSRLCWLVTISVFVTSTTSQKQIGIGVNTSLDPKMRTTVTSSILRKSSNKLWSLNSTRICKRKRKRENYLTKTRQLVKRLRLLFGRNQSQSLSKGTIKAFSILRSSSIRAGSQKSSFIQI